MTTTTRDYLLMHLVVAAWGFTAILGKLITLPAVDVTIWRTGVAAACFALLARFTGGQKISASQALRFAAVGAVLGIHWVLFFLATRLSTASVCLAAMPTAMLWSSLIEPLIDGTRKWRALELLVGLMMVGAVWIIYQVEFSYWKGFTVAIIAAVLAAVFAVMSKQQVGACHWSRIGAWQMLGAFIAAFLSRPLFETGFWPVVPVGPDRLWIGILAIFCTVAAYAGFMKALRQMSVFSMNVIYNLEPVYGIILAALIFGSSEFMSPGFYFGASIIIASVVSLPWLRKVVEA
ncbi:MAG: DMT family transporter [Verrucomicrobiaceae bacterium]|nr:DMT family transporter [Verrucomicrobiaceae bacterium]